jgi:hypothetical protein
VVKRGRLLGVNHVRQVLPVGARGLKRFYCIKELNRVSNASESCG